MFKSSLNKAKLDELYDKYYSNAVRLYANFLKAKSKDAIQCLFHSELL